MHLSQQWVSIQSIINALRLLTEEKFELWFFSLVLVSCISSPFFTLVNFIFDNVWFYAQVFMFVNFLFDIVILFFQVYYSVKTQSLSNVIFERFHAILLVRINTNELDMDAVGELPDTLLCLEVKHVEVALLLGNFLYRVIFSHVFVLMQHEAEVVLEQGRVFQRCNLLFVTFLWFLRLTLNISLLLISLTFTINQL